MLRPTTIRKIPIDHIVDPSDHNRTLDNKHVDYLAGEIKSHGLQHPITVISRDDGMFDLVAGLHRWAACIQLEHSDIECKILDPSTSKAELIEISVAENQVRKSESLSSTFRRIDKIRKLRKCTFTKAGQYASVSKSVTSKLNVIHKKLTPRNIKLVDDNSETLGLSLAYEVATKAKSGDQQTEWLEAIIAGRMTRDEITRSVKTLPKQTAAKVKLNLAVDDATVNFAFPKSASYDRLFSTLATIKDRLAALQKRGIHIDHLPEYLSEGA